MIPRRRRRNSDDPVVIRERVKALTPVEKIEDDIIKAAILKTVIERVKSNVTFEYNSQRDRIYTRNLEQVKKDLLKEFDQKYWVIVLSTINAVISEMRTQIRLDIIRKTKKKNF